MNLLIVDDEELAIETLKKQVDWEKLSIESVFTAMSMKEAIEQFEQHSIDILLCDIEMPMGTGLDLLKWTQGIKLNVASILMTCHADFTYAQQAIHLGSLDYLLKPLSYEQVETVVMKAVMKINYEKAMKQNSGAWLQNKDMVARQFWKEYFVGEIVPTQESLEWYTLSKGIEINLEHNYLPVLVSIKKMRSEFTKEERRLMEFAMKNTAEEIFGQVHISKQIMTFKEGRLLIIFEKKQGDDTGSLANTIMEGLRQLIYVGKEYLKLIVCCYVGSEDSIYKMPGMIEKLHTIDFNNVALQRDITLLSTYNHSPVEYENSTFSLWADLISSNKFDTLQEEIKVLLTAEEILRKIDRQYLRDFYQGYNYLLFVFCTKHKIFLNELLRGEQMNQMLQLATTSLADLLNWIEYTTNKMKSYVVENVEAHHPVDKAKKYIEVHIAEDIAVEEIAQKVHLNSDYLTRIFKKEMGISISKYIIQRKMEIAKELMRKTEKSIGDIATEVGYFNYSSFNRIFNKVVGMSPQEFKMEYGRKSK